MKKYLLILLLINLCLKNIAQINYTDYENPFPNTYLNLNNNGYADIGVDINNMFFIGTMNLNPRQSGFIFKRGHVDQSFYKIYYANTQTRLTSLITKTQLKNFYSFQSTDSDAGCSSAGLKIFKLNKNDLSVADSVFFCDPLKPTGGSGYYIYNHFYVTSSFIQLLSTTPPYNQIMRNIIRRIDTNLVMLNETIVGDTSISFGTFKLVEAIDTGIIMNTRNETEHCPMLIKIDTLGNEIWRKNYYTIAQTGGCGTTQKGIVGLQNYQNGYIALFNASDAGACNYFYKQSIVAKIDKTGNMVKEVQYNVTGDTTLELYSNLSNNIIRAKFYDILIKTNDGNFASVMSDNENYDINNQENYIVILDTNLNIIHRSPKLGSIYGLDNPNLAQTSDSTLYLAGGIMNNINDGMNIRIYNYKKGGVVGVNEYSNDSEIKMYPNPTNSIINIQDNDGQLEGTTIEIINYLGQKITSVLFSPQIDVSNLSEGLYIIKIKSDKGTLYNTKFIKVN